MARRLPSNFSIVQQVEDEKKAPDTASETKKMTGFAGIDDVAAAAPEKASNAGIASPSRSAATSPRQRKATQEQQKEEERQKAVEEALSKVGVEMMKELAMLPYEAWAFFFSDPALRLTPQESEQLANTYYLIAKALKPEQITSLKVLLALAALQNVRIAVVKLRAHAERTEKQKKEKASLNSTLNLGDAQVSIV
jgi:uncharacterized protein with GYD domain